MPDREGYTLCNLILLKFKAEQTIYSDGNQSRSWLWVVGIHWNGAWGDFWDNGNFPFFDCGVGSRCILLLKLGSFQVVHFTVCAFHCVQMLPRFLKM